MEASLKMVLKMVVMFFAVVSTMFGGVQGNEVVQWNEKKVCIPVIPCGRQMVCCSQPPPVKATNS